MSLKKLYFCDRCNQVSCKTCVGKQRMCPKCLDQGLDPKTKVGDLKLYLKLFYLKKNGFLLDGMRMWEEGWH